MTVFVDTSAWYAAADLDDASHSRGSSLLRRYEGNLLTSDHVVVELWFLARARLGRDTAERLVDGIRSGVARLESTTDADLTVAVQIGTDFPDQDFSIVDRTSWAVMQRLGVHEAISFDRDFDVYRFGPNRKRAFTVHR